MGRSAIQPSTLLLDSQSVLFTIEYVVLSEYFELFCQVFYVFFVACLSQLPSATYHAELTNSDGELVEIVLTNNLLFMLLKLVSFMLLFLTLWRVSGHDVLRHLSFVLETRMVHMQSKMLV